MTLQSFFFLSYLCDALATAANGIVADSLGRQDFSRAQEAAAKCLLYGAAVTAALALLLGLQPMGVAAIFTDQQCARSLQSQLAYCCSAAMSACVAAAMSACVAHWLQETCIVIQKSW